MISIVIGGPLAFPLIASGIYGYPKEEALQVAITAFSEFLLHNEMDIYLVVYDRRAISLSEKLFTEIDHYIETYYDDSDEYETRSRLNRIPDEFNQIYADLDGASDQRSIKKSQKADIEAPMEEDNCFCMYEAMPRSLDHLFGQMDETFSEMLLRLIDEKGRSDVEVYKKANIDRKLFSKIRSDKSYQPKKRTALAFAIALELSVDETKDLLMKAGYTLSNSNRFDLIIRYFIDNESYDMFVINEALFNYEQPLLGA